MKPLRIILIIIIFIAFFEIGLISSYTIVTTEVPDVKGIIQMQIDKITEIINPESVNKVFMKDPTKINITNKGDVSLAIQTLSDIDGVDLNSMNVSTYDSTKDSKQLNVTIECLGYADPETNSSQIVLSNTPSYKIVASATVKIVDGHYKVVKDSIKIQSILKLYNGNS